MGCRMEFELIDGWTSAEHDVARQAFTVAHERAIQKLVFSLRERVAALSSDETVWEFHDFLSIERHSIEGRFAFQLDGILFVFASFVKEDLLQLDELAGLEPDKLAKIAAMARF